MPKLLRETSLQDAAQIILKAQSPLATTAQKYMDGDHYQDSAGWIGPMPQPNEPGAMEVRREIQRGFTSRNAIAEVVHRHKNGVMGREPAWNFTVAESLRQDEKISDQDQALIDQAEAVITEWWDRRRVHEMLQKAVEYSLHQGRGPVRIFFPRGRVREVTRTAEDGSSVTETVVSATTLEEALDLIHVDVPHPKDATVAEDPETLEEVGVFMYITSERQVLEVTFKDGFGLDAVTTLRIESSGEQVTRTWNYNLNGRLLMQQIKRTPLVSKQVVEQQKALNLAETMIPRNVITGGFLERVILNAQMPGKWIADESMPTGRRFVPEPLYTGAGTTNILSGKEYRDLDGSVRIANPSVVYRDPVSPKASIEAGDAHRMHILNEVDQTHVSIAGDAFASAVSRVEAKMDYLSSLRTTQAPTEAVGRWLLETVLWLACEIVRRSGGELPADDMAQRLKAEFRCRLQVGNITPDEQRAIMELVEAGLLSREDAMALLGVDNVDDMLAKINGQPGAMLDLSEKQAKVFKQWVEAGATPEFAARMAGLEPEESVDLVAEVKRRRGEQERQQAALAAQQGAPAGAGPAAA